MSHAEPTQTTLPAFTSASMPLARPARLADDGSSMLQAEAFEPPKKSKAASYADTAKGGKP
jgi:hypothetical protein